MSKATNENQKGFMSTFSDLIDPKKKPSEDTSTSAATSPVTTSDYVRKPKSATIISEDVIITGDINSKGDIEICGCVTGNITLDGHITISGKVHGNITAGSLSINGGTLTGEKVECVTDRKSVV